MVGQPASPRGPNQQGARKARPAWNPEERYPVFCIASLVDVRTTSLVVMYGVPTRQKGTAATPPRGQEGNRLATSGGGFSFVACRPRRSVALQANEGRLLEGRHRAGSSSAWENPARAVGVRDVLLLKQVGLGVNSLSSSSDTCRFGTPASYSGTLPSTPLRGSRRLDGRVMTHTPAHTGWYS